MNQTNCSKCGGAMTDGFLIDHGHLQIKGEQIWVEGSPEKSFWKELQTSGRATYKVRAERCTECGFLEFYASENTDSGSKFSEIFT